MCGGRDCDLVCFIITYRVYAKETLGPVGPVLSAPPKTLLASFPESGTLMQRPPAIAATRFRLQLSVPAEPVSVMPLDRRSDRPWLYPTRKESTDTVSSGEAIQCLPEAGSTQEIVPLKMVRKAPAYRGFPLSEQARRAIQNSRH